MRSFRAIFNVFVSIAIVLSLCVAQLPAAWAQNATSTVGSYGAGLGEALLVGEIPSSAELTPTEGWTKSGSCEWAMDYDAGAFTVRPINGKDAGCLSGFPWKSFATTIEKIVLEGEIQILDCTSAFSGMKCLREVVGLSNINPMSSLSMAFMFEGCTALESLDLTGLDTSGIKNMNSMFHLCKSLTSIDFTGFDTSKVTDMTTMFSGCASLEAIDLSGFDTSSTTSMCSPLSGGLFFGCESLKSLDLSSLDTSNITDMSSMFAGCSSLEVLDLSPLDTSRVMNMSNMFNGCNSLRTLDLSVVDTRAIANMNGTFSDCYSLESVNLSGIDTRSLSETAGMFSNCYSLKSVDFSDFDTSNVERSDHMFTSCRSLSEITIGSKFSVREGLPCGYWKNESGVLFAEEDIPAGVCGTYRFHGNIKSIGLDFSSKTVKLEDGHFYLNAVLESRGWEGELIWISQNTDVAEVDDFGKVTPRRTGKTVISVTADDFTASCEITVVASPKEYEDDFKDANGMISMSKTRAHLLTKSMQFTGKSLTPPIAVYLGNKRLTENVHYKVASTGNVNVGSGFVQIIGLGIYSGATHMFFDIVPKNFSISKLVGSKRSFTVKWKKPASSCVGQTTACKIRYSTYKSMKKAKTKTLGWRTKAWSKRSWKITKLKPKKTYYVQIQTRKTVNGKSYCSAWSKVKKVRTK